jgi:hypothetical protein
LNTFALKPKSFTYPNRHRQADQEVFCPIGNREPIPS